MSDKNQAEQKELVIEHLNRLINLIRSDKATHYQIEQDNGIGFDEYKK